MNNLFHLCFCWNILQLEIQHYQFPLTVFRDFDGAIEIQYNCLFRFTTLILLVFVYTCKLCLLLHLV